MPSQRTEQKRTFDAGTEHRLRDVYDRMMDAILLFGDSIREPSLDLDVSILDTILDNPKHWRERAEEARAIADQLSDRPEAPGELRAGIQLGDERPPAPSIRRSMKRRKRRRGVACADASAWSRCDTFMSFPQAWPNQSSIASFVSTRSG
jgi:hypothetical protein